jgi:hypothetical protein
MLHYSMPLMAVSGVPTLRAAAFDYLTTPSVTSGSDHNDINALYHKMFNYFTSKANIVWELQHRRIRDLGLAINYHFSYPCPFGL